MVSRASAAVGAHNAMRLVCPASANSFSHSAPVLVLPKPRPAITSQPFQSPSVGNCDGRAFDLQPPSARVSARIVASELRSDVVDYLRRESHWCGFVVQQGSHHRAARVRKARTGAAWLPNTAPLSGSEAAGEPTISISAITGPRTRMIVASEFIVQVYKITRRC